MKKVNDFTRTTKEIKTELNLFCVLESQWSGKITIDQNLGDIGQKDWYCDISLAPNADYAAELHERLHVRSISYYDIEEDFAELLT